MKLLSNIIQRLGYALISRLYSIPRLLKYGRIDLNTCGYWNQVWADEERRGVRRDEGYGELQERILELVPAGAHVLDAGCGSGGLLRRLNERPSVTLYGCDHSEVAVRAASAHCSEARVVQLPDMPREWQDSFDVITCTEVLEHLKRPDDAIFSLIRCLRQSGRLMVSVPDDCLHPIHCDEHLQAFTEVSFNRLLARRLDDVEIEHIACSNGARYLLGIGTVRQSEG